MKAIEIEGIAGVIEKVNGKRKTTLQSLVNHILVGDKELYIRPRETILKLYGDGEGIKPTFLETVIFLAEEWPKEFISLNKWELEHPILEGSTFGVRIGFRKGKIILTERRLETRDIVLVVK